MKPRKNKLIIDTTDPRGIPVTCTRDDFYGHIKRGHPDVEKPGWIAATIQDPCKICKSNKNDTAEVYYKTDKKLFHTKPKAHRLRVIVDKENGESIVKTAVFTFPDKKVVEGILKWEKPTE